MTWVRFDDQYPDHPKIVEVGPLGLALHVAATCYCARYLTDGFVPAKVISRLISFDGINVDRNGVTNTDITKMITDELTRVGLLEKTDGGYFVHDYLEYNPTSEKIKAERARNKERQSKFRKRNAVTNSVSNPVSNNAPSPSPSPLNKLLLVEEARPEIFSTYEKEMGPLTPMIADELQLLEKEYPLEWIGAAFKEAALNNKRNLKYAGAILKRWRSEGFLSERPAAARQGARSNGAQVTKQELIRQRNEQVIRELMEETNGDNE